MIIDEEKFRRWCDSMRCRRLLGPGCGSSEYEGSDWVEAVRVRLRSRPDWVRQIEQY